jgi:hypothetical protein
MIKRSTFITVIFIFVLLALGLVLFRVLNPADPAEAADDNMRVWLWENRGLDLIVQVALVFAGALGIAAILPVEENDD